MEEIFLTALVGVVTGAIVRNAIKNLRAYIDEQIAADIEQADPIETLWGRVD